MAAPPPTKKVKVNNDSNSLSSGPLLFKGFRSYLVEQGLGKVRYGILKRQMENHGGLVDKDFTSYSTHIFVNKGVRKERLLKILKKAKLDGNVKVILVDWISECLIKGELVDEIPYEAYKDICVVDEKVNLLNQKSAANETKINKIDVNDRKDITDSGTLIESTMEYGCSSSSGYHNLVVSGIEADTEITTKNSTCGDYVCAKPSTLRGENFNKHITDKLQLLQDEYTSTQDKWRSFGYKKAIGSISKYHKPLETYEEVMSLPSVGERLAKKIWEIIETGHLKRLDHIDPKVEILKLFSGVWGAGPKTAEQWFSRGFKSLDDLPKDELTLQQKIGLKHYKDINEEMPRSEVAEIETLIRKHAELLLPGVILTVCGSYRRGRPFCGDIDLLVSHPDGSSHEGFLLTLLNRLKEVELITDDLITVENKTQRKYMGLCKLPGDKNKYRRIDFIVAPYSEWSCALMHFTGSAHLNRSVRLLAKKKKMSLSEHALRKNVVRGPTGEKINQGEVIPISSEADIFNMLELEYLEPTERDW